MYPDGQAVTFESIFGNTIKYDDGGNVAAARATIQVGPSAHRVVVDCCMLVIGQRLRRDAHLGLNSEYVNMFQKKGDQDHHHRAFTVVDRPIKQYHNLTVMCMWSKKGADTVLATSVCVPYVNGTNQLYFCLKGIQLRRRLQQIAILCPRCFNV